MVIRIESYNKYKPLSLGQARDKHNIDSSYSRYINSLILIFLTFLLKSMNEGLLC